MSALNTLAGRNAVARMCGIAAVAACSWYMAGCGGSNPVASSPPTLTLPVNTTQPQSQTIASGTTATLSVTATGTAPLTYQWYSGSSGTTTNPIAGATASDYTTPALMSTTSYWVRVANVGGNTDSITAMITVTPFAITATVTTQPQSQTIASGTPATLSVTATGTAPLSYQWYSGTSGTTTNPIAGATGSSYTTPGLTTTTSYWVRVANASGSAASTTATITVTSTAIPPTITTQPQSQTIASGTTATLSVTATGTAPFSYQWYSGSSRTTTNPIAGATASSYTTPALTTTTSYWVRVANVGGSADSTAAMITVTQPATTPTITTQPQSQTIASGTTATLSVTATGTAPLSYLWYGGPSGTTTNPIAGATASSYTTPGLTTTTSYWVRVANASGSAASTTATISISASANRTITSGSLVTVSNVNGDATLTLSGTGFALSGTLTDGGTSACDPCVAGQPKSIGLFGGFNGVGSGTVDGISYQRIFFNTNFRLVSNQTVPTTGAPQYSVPFPFSMSGVTFDGYSDSQHANQIFHFVLSGSGGATLEVVQAAPTLYYNRPSAALRFDFR